LEVYLLSSDRYTLGHCEAGELPALIDLANRVFRDPDDTTGDMGREFPLLFDPSNAENLRVARRGGRIVSHVGLCIREASVLGASLRVGLIGAVATDPDDRGHGLATRLMHDARDHARTQGVSLLLISGGRGLYQRLGYVETGRFTTTAVPAGEVGSVRCRLAEPADLPAVIALHQREPVRFFRPRRDWDRLIAVGMLMNRRADVYVVEAEGGAAAYAGVQRPQNERGPAAMEIGGSRNLLAQALPALAAVLGADVLRVTAAADDREWEALANARAWERHPVPFNGTVGIIDTARFARAMEPVLAEREPGLVLRGDGENLVLERPERSTRFQGMSAATRAVFDGEAAEAGLPLPLLWYGYNYI
jgi:predicted N-acetyltransferase YhbS